MYQENPKGYYPPMHTAEHLLNQTMVRIFNKGRSFSNHIEKKKSKCDYKGFDRNLTDKEIEAIENKVREMINADLPVSDEVIEFDEAKEKFNLGNLPDEFGEKIRIVKVGDYDACPCSGEHVESTKEIGGFRIVSSSFDGEVLRVRFKLG